jgi:DNA replication and repair protein RecF
VHLEHLTLVDFRSYETVDLPLGPGVTVLLGGNGNGKTNLLEAVGYLATYGSHRVAADAAMVRAGCNRAVVRARVRRGERVATTDVEIRPGSPLRVQINRAAVQRPRRSPSLVRAVVFAPEDLALVRGDPDRRRRFLDELLGVRAPRMVGVRADYDRVVRQRTALLKSLRASSASARSAAAAAMDVWDEQLADLGAELVQGRLELLDGLVPHAVAAYDEVSGDSGPLALTYDARGLPGGLPAALAAVGPGAGAAADPAAARTVLADALREAAVRRRGDEADRGVCLVGPHRDDVEISVRGLAAKGYASHGEAWSVALALRLASFDLLRADDDEDAQPVLVLDDVFAELDAARRTHLARRAGAAEQALLSVAAVEDVPAGLVHGAAVSRTVRVVRDPGTTLSRVSLEGD